MPRYNGQYEDFEGGIFGFWTLIDYTVEYNIIPAQKQTRENPGYPAELETWDLKIVQVKDENYSPISFSPVHSQKLYEIVNQGILEEKISDENCDY